MCIFLPEKQTGSKPKANQKQTGNKKEKEIEIEFEIELELELELEGEGDNGCYPLIPPLRGSERYKDAPKNTAQRQMFCLCRQNFFPVTKKD